MKLKFYKQVINILPILLLFLTTCTNNIKAQGVDAVFVLDNSNSIEPSEWTDISNSTKKLMDKILACNSYNRIAVVHYALNLSGFKSNLYVESEFTSNAAIAKNFVRRSSILGLNTGTHQALGIVNDIVGGISNSNVLSTRKILTPISTNKLVIFLFTDGTNNDAIKIPFYEGPGGLFDNYNKLKTSKGATFVVLQGFSDAYAGEEPAKQAAAAIASVGGSYTGTVQDNPGDPQGNGVTPRKMIYSPTFNVSSVNIATLADNICKSCAPVVNISAVTPPSQNICLNGTPQPLVATATGTGTLSYQWYSNTVNSNTGGNLISGATSANFLPPTSLSGTNFYYVVASDTYCEGKTTSSIVSVTVSNMTCTTGECYKPAATASSGTSLISKIGISSLNRLSTTTDNWPAVRKGGWLVLESRTKGFVPNRIAFDSTGNPIGIAPINFVEGMMVYDTTNKCLKIYTSADGGNTFSWKCITTQTCPD